MLELLGLLIVLGVVFYLVGLIPMGEPFPQIIKIVAILIAVVLILNALGVHLFDGFNLE
jgi:hypothetical protein